MALDHLVAISTSFIIHLFDVKGTAFNFKINAIVWWLG
jgi:hypothetical protein